jgi:hypothetical protein
MQRKPAPNAGLHQPGTYMQQMDYLFAPDLLFEGHEDDDTDAERHGAAACCPRGLSDR